MRRIDSIDLSPVKFKLVEEHGWAREKADTMEREYRRFLYLCTSQAEVPVVPSEDIDEFWHNHILDTRKYATDCQEVFGRFVHHFPYLGMRGEEDAKLLQRSFEETKGLYERVFGEKYKGSPNDCENCGSCTASCGVCSGSGAGGRSDLRIGFDRRPTLASLVPAGGCTSGADCYSSSD